MARVTQRLEPKDVRKIVKDVEAALKAKRPVKPGWIADGGGLYLRTPQLSWVSRLRFGAGKRIEMGHGSTRRGVKLAEARDAHEKALQLLRAGMNPIIERKVRRTQAATIKTFKQAAREFLPILDAEIDSPVTRAHWRSLLLGEVVNADGTVSKAEHNYCAKLHDVPVGAIDTSLILAVLNRIWTTKPETASRLRGRIERVLSWAIGLGMGGNVTLDNYRNPARWDGHLEHMLAKRNGTQTTKHLAAVDYAQLPTFYAQLAEQGSVAARAFQFAILTACRTGDLRGQDGRDDRPPMRWEHVDLDAGTWTIPRTKTGVEHRVPLSTQAIALLKSIRNGRTSGVVFTGDKPGKPISNSTMLMLIRRMVKAGLVEKGSVTVHGTARAGFKSWASDETDADPGVIEACLSHVIRGKVEAAYRRSDFYAKRTNLMQDWADYVTSKVHLNGTGQRPSGGR